MVEYNEKVCTILIHGSFTDIENSHCKTGVVSYDSKELVEIGFFTEENTRTWPVLCVYTDKTCDRITLIWTKFYLKMNRFTLRWI